MFSNILQFIILLLLPTQLGKHFWPPFSYVAGFRIDYLSPTVYLIDVLIVIYLSVSLKMIWLSFLKHQKSFVFYIVLISANTLFSANPAISIYGFIKLTIYILFALVLKHKKQKNKVIFYPVIISAVLVIILGILQIINNGSLNGLMYYFGERSLNLSTSVVAKTSIFGTYVLRAYSTFSHPNSLAGYLVVVSIIAQSLNTPKTWQAVLFTGVGSTFSRAGLIAYVSSLIRNKTVIAISILLLVISPLIIVCFGHLTTSKSITERKDQIIQSLQIIVKYPLFGSGYKSYINVLEKQLPERSVSPINLQPVHNTFLLLLCEFGIIGVILILKLLSGVIKDKQKIGVLLLALIITGSFDHYWLTLHQNQLIIILVLINTNLITNRHESKTQRINYQY